MSHKNLIWVGCCFGASLSVVALLFLLSRSMRERQGSFLRQFPPHPALEAGVINLGFNSYYIAGATGHQVYLANYSAPLHLIVLHTDRMDTSHIRLKVLETADQKFAAIRVKVDSPYFYVTDGSVPRIFRGDIVSWTARRALYDSAYFLDLEPFSGASFAIRALGKPIRENTLGKITMTKPHVRMSPQILQKQVDGVFCTDGCMRYNKQLAELVYLYFYRNEFIFLDSNMNVARRGRTIDTTAHANIKLETITATGETKLAIPQRFVNRSCSFSGKFLFVNSPVIARNENAAASDRATAIDVYEAKSGKYRFSFYVYDYRKNERMKSFLVSGDRMYVLFDHYLQVWNLVPSYFKDES